VRSPKKASFLRDRNLTNGVAIAAALLNKSRRINGIWYQWNLAKSGESQLQPGTVISTNLLGCVVAASK
jgi:hypothetical protein